MLGDPSKEIEMKKIVIALVLTLALVLSLVGIAGAITNGKPDGNAHPYVGLLVFDADIPGYGVVPGLELQRRPDRAKRSIDQAGHCTDGAVAAGTLSIREEKLQNADFSYIVSDFPWGGGESTEGIPYVNPDSLRPRKSLWRRERSSCLLLTRDVGIVVLAEAVDVGGFAVLPSPGLVKTLKNKTAIDFVGYGVQYQVQIPGVYLPQPPPYYRWGGYYNRYYAPSELVSGKFVHSAEYLRLALNPGGGSGGLCFGNSGGPDLLGGTNIVLGVNSYVTNINCSGVGYSARVDIPEVLEWIQSFIE